MTEQEIDKLAKKVWDYHLMGHALVPADVIMVFGSYDERVPLYAIELYKKGYAPYILFSGASRGLSTELFGASEGEYFAGMARKAGVPEDVIVVESKSMNTAENVRFSMPLLDKRGIKSDKVIIVQKPHMQRRSYATFKKQFPDKECILVSPPISYEDYPNEKITKDFFIPIMLSDLRGIKELAEKGVQIPQEIPKDVWEAYEELGVEYEVR